MIDDFIITLFNYYYNFLTFEYAGDDVFYNGKDKDELHGDYGFDRYYIQGSGHTIYDTDGLGEVFFNGRKLWSDPNFKSEWIEIEAGQSKEHIISGIKPTFKIIQKMEQMNIVPTIC